MERDLFGISLAILSPIIMSLEAVFNKQADKRTAADVRWHASLCKVAWWHGTKQTNPKASELRSSYLRKQLSSAGTDGVSQFYDGYLVGADRSKDLAVIRINAPPVCPLCYADPTSAGVLSLGLFDIIPITLPQSAMDYDKCLRG